MELDRFARARVLLEQGRFDLAAREVTARLADAPDDPEGHILLALCRHNLNDPKADETARSAVALAPNEDRAHFVYSLTQWKRDHLDEAERAIRRAIELNSWNAGYFGQLAAIDVSRYRWSAALKSADGGLAIDPDDETCLNLRAAALTKLGRHADAAATLEGALEKHPEDALSHANRGWTLLHENEPRKAIEHFRESLRLDPTREWAKEGLREALRAKNWFYRRVLQFFLLLSRFPPRVQFGLIVGMILVIRVLDDLGERMPAAAPFFNALILAYVGFVAATWFAKHIMNVLLLFDRDGRTVLDRGAAWVSSICCLLVLVVLVLAVVAIFGRASTYVSYALVAFLVAVHFSSVFEIPAGRYRRIGIAVSALVLIAFASLKFERIALVAEFERLLERAKEHDARADVFQEKDDDESQSKKKELKVQLFLIRDASLRMRGRADQLDRLESWAGFASLGGLLLHSYLGVRARRYRDPD